MTSSTVERPLPTATNVCVGEDELTVSLSDGRVISAPIGWYPRLVHGTAMERANFQLIGSGRGIHWPDLDEDVSISNLIHGQPSGESQESLNRWLKGRS